jgi:hypothetical protein
MITMQPPAGEGGYTTIILADSAQAPIVVPGGNLLLTADFVRDGADLVLVGADGRTVVLRGYFETGHQADLMTEGGARIAAQLATQLAGPLAPGQYAQAGVTDAVAGDDVATLSNVAGDVFVIRAEGTRVQAANGMVLGEGD